MTESLNKPFGTYIKLYSTSLQDDIATWLTDLSKSIDDVTWWEIHVSLQSLFDEKSWPLTQPYLPPQYKVRITLAFADSDTKYAKKFTCGSLSKAVEALRSRVAVPQLFYDAFKDGELDL